MSNGDRPREEPVWKFDTLDPSGNLAENDPLKDPNLTKVNVSEGSRQGLRKVTIERSQMRPTQFHLNCDHADPGVRAAVLNSMRESKDFAHFKDDWFENKSTTKGDRAAVQEALSKDLEVQKALDVAEKRIGEEEAAIRADNDRMGKEQYAQEQADATKLASLREKTKEFSKSEGQQ